MIEPWELANTGIVRCFIFRMDTHLLPSSGKLTSAARPTHEVRAELISLGLTFGTRTLNIPRRRRAESIIHCGHGELWKKDVSHSRSFGALETHYSQAH